MTNTKKIGFYALLAAALLFTGCSQKQVEPEKEEVKQEVAQAQPEAVDQMVTTTEQEEVVTDEMIINSVRTVHFGFDKYNLTENTRSTVTNNASALANLRDHGLKLEGNCDAYGSDEYNFALGLKRAKAVKDALVADGIAADKIATVSFGESNPVCATDLSEDCRAQNRRVDFKLAQ